MVDDLHIFFVINAAPFDRKDLNAFKKSHLAAAFYCMEVLGFIEYESACFLTEHNKIKGCHPKYKLITKQGRMKI